jgi:hypothetical protein
MCQGKNLKLIQDLTLKIISNIYLKHVGFTRIFCVINFFGGKKVQPDGIFRNRSKILLAEYRSY